MIRAFGQYAQNQSDYGVLVDQINKINSQINVVVNKYNSISNDIFSVSTNISTFNENLSRVTVELNNINQSIDSLENEISKINNSNFSLAYYITDHVLSKAITDYKNYGQLRDVEIFEPYVQSIGTLDFINDNRGFKYNLPNCTLNASQYPEFMAVRYLPITLNKYMNGNMVVNDASIKTLSNCNIDATRCSFDYVYANNCNLLNCDLQYVSCDLNCKIQGCVIPQITMNMGNLRNCYIFSLKTPGTLNTTNNTRNVNIENCTIAKYASDGCIYNKMTVNDVTNALECNFNTCVINCINTGTNYSFENCSFNDVSIYHLTHTNFINCSGNIYIPRIINGKNMFDNNNQYLGGLPSNQTLNTSSTYSLTDTNSYSTQIETNIDTFSTYTGSYTYNDISTSYSTIDTTTIYTYQPITNTNTILESTTNTTMYDTYITVYDGETYTATRTDFIPIIRETTGTLTDNYQIPTLTILDITDTITNTFTDTYTTQISYNPQLEVNILPEWKTPNLFTNNIIAENYQNTFVNIDYYTDSINKFGLNNCTGNVMMYVDSVSENFIIANNQLYKCELNLSDYGTQFIITANNIKNLDLYLNSNDTPAFTMSMNNIDKMNLLYNFTATSSIIFEKNSFKDFNIDAVAKGNLRMSSCTINNGVLYGWNGLYDCSANYIENYGENSYSKNSINTLRAHNINLMFDNTIDKLIIEPNEYDNLSFYGNSIKTIICPSYFPISASAIHNTFDTIIAY